MPSMHSLELVIRINQLSFLQKLARFPNALKMYYKIFSKNMPFYKVIYGAWLMGGLSIVVENEN